MQDQGLDTVPNRRRGRPTGKNRVPLSAEQRRARNAQYERERRNDCAEAFSQLAEAACCSPHISNAELLATVISNIQRSNKRKATEDIVEMKRINANLEMQIATLESRLVSEPETHEHDSIKKHKPNQQFEIQSDSSPQAPDPSSKNNTKRNSKKHNTKKEKKSKIKVTEEKQAEPVYSYEQPLTSNLETSAVEFNLSADIGQIDTSELNIDIDDIKNWLNSDSETNVSSKSEDSHDLHNMRNRMTSQQSWADDEHQSEYSNQSEYEASAQQITPAAQTAIPITPTLSEPDVTQSIQESQTMLDLFTDREKGILTEWFNCNNLLDPDPQRDSHANPVYNWYIDNNLFTGCF